MIRKRSEKRVEDEVGQSFLSENDDISRTRCVYHVLAFDTGWQCFVEIEAVRFCPWAFGR